MINECRMTKLNVVNKKSQKLAVVMVGAVLLAACDWILPQTEEHPVVRVGQKYLYESDLEGVVPLGVSTEDSTLLVQDFVNRWVDRQLLISKAEMNIDTESDEFQRLISQYREDLLLSAYKEAVIAEYLDTLVSESELQAYYEEHMSTFRLNRDLARLRFIYIDAKASKLKDAKKWMVRGDSSSLARLEEYCFKYSSSFSVADSTWIPLDEIEERIPGFEEEWRRSGKKNREIIEIQDSTDVYLVHFYDYRQKGEIAPMVYVKDIVKSIIYNRRKFRLISDVQSDIKEDALNNKKLEFYE